jgi:Glycosyltransferase family 87
MATTGTATVTGEEAVEPRWRPVHLFLVAGLTVSFVLLLLVGSSRQNAAKPGLGPSSAWAPSDWPWTPGPALVTGLLWTAYLLGATCVLVHLAVGLPRRATWWLGLLQLVVVATTGPFGSADHTNYAAYGRIAAQGGDPYLIPPSAWSATDPVTTAVRPPWDSTTSIYGPFATLVQSWASRVGGDNLRLTVWAWQLVVVASWLLVCVLLERRATSRRRVRALWTFNPLVFGVGVLGAHVDLLATALVLAALVTVHRRPWLAGLLTGLAVSTKVTTGVLVLAVLLGWWMHERRGFARRTTQFVVTALVVALPLHFWAGPHVFDQLDRARRSISLATPWRLLFQLLQGPLGGSTSRTLVSSLAVVLTLAFAVVLLRLTADLVPPTASGAAVRWTFVLTTAYVLCAPYSLPWYLLLTWATLPLLAGSVLDRVLLGHFLAMAVAYVPGRVEGMTPAVERTTLWVRRSLVPYAVLLVWGWLTRAAGRGWRHPRAPRPPAP